MSREVVTSLNDHEYLSLKNSVLMTNFLVKKLVSPSFFFNKEIIQGYGNLHIEKEIDQKYVKNIYENELKNLTNYLNKINNINKDVKYWEILIGTWLYRFINFLYNRYQTINKIIRDKKEKIVFRVTSNQNYNFLASENTEEFYSNLIDNCWNDTCFKKILIEQFKNLKIKEIKFLYESKKNIEIKIELKQKLKFFIFDIIDLITKSYRKKNNYLIYQSFLGFVDNFKLNLSLGQLGNFSRNVTKKTFKTSNYNKELREEFKKDLNQKKKSNFEGCLHLMLPYCLPKCFLESFNDYDLASENLDFPKNPKVIFTTIAHDHDMLFKFWLSKKKDNCKILIGQHGSNYQTKKIHIGEIEKNISTNFLCWGKKKNNLKDFTAFNFKTSNLEKFKNKKKNPKKNIYLVLKTAGQQMETWDRAYEYYSYILDIEKVIHNFKANFFNFDLRLSHTWVKKKTSDLDFFRKILPSSQIDTAEDSIFEKLQYYDVCVFTYDSSGFLELLALNIPVILYQPNILEEINENVKDDYLKMISANIIFVDLKKLSIFLKDNVSHIHKWWSNEFVNQTKNQFINNYSLPYTKKRLKALSNLLKESTYEVI